MNNKKNKNNGLKYHFLSLLPPLIALIGLHKFTKSFFLSKKSILHTSPCDANSASNLLVNVLGLSEQEVELLYQNGILSRHYTDNNNNDNDNNVISDGCWMPRRVESMAIIVVDALRFDFALDHLPASIGSRIKRQNELNDHTNDTSNNIQQQQTKARGSSQLYKFVADPPTVTVQRLKGITTGGLPTFSDITGNFGGADVTEDSWVQQLRDCPSSKRGLDTSKIAFVGDDTWIDLFPNQFHDFHPYPSFNTRDLDTVDNGCLEHLPRLLKSFGLVRDSSSTTLSIVSGKEQREDFFEVVVTHFLGVDHVGHTYGSHNTHMDAKLHQIDEALNVILDKIDDAKDTCELAFIFGDHGMTEDGNHGGGTIQEVNAALFAHYSPGCGSLGQSIDITGSEIGAHSVQAFTSINQIDLVPTISLLLGLPIPFSSLGGLVPALFPPLHIHRKVHDNNSTSTSTKRNHDIEAPFAATALALNAAQVWNYFTTYSKSNKQLPRGALEELNLILRQATATFKMALSQPNGSHDSLAYREACGLYKYFLSEATDLGKAVWTNFDTNGMVLGIVTLITASYLGCPFSFISLGRSGLISIILPLLGITSRCQYQNFETTLTVILMIFQTIVITFSNSYIEFEASIILMFLAILCITKAFYIYLQKNLKESVKTKSDQLLKCSSNRFLSIIICSRLHTMLVKGHGQDPMLRQYGSHNSAVFLSSLFLLCILRLYYSLHIKNKYPNTRLKFSDSLHTSLDLCCMIFLAISWYEKRSIDVNRQGFFSVRLAIGLCLIGFMSTIIEMILFKKRQNSLEMKVSVVSTTHNDVLFHEMIRIILKMFLLLIIITGPSAASSSVFIVIQMLALRDVTSSMTQPCLVAALWRLCIRHDFFATGHSCQLNRLQFSAAFVATSNFHYYLAGSSLFLNTFGWDILGTILLLVIVERSGRKDIFSWYCFYQLMESVGSCISVSLMRRHLMVWAIFAPRFVFASIYLIICMLIALLHPLVDC